MISTQLSEKYIDIKLTKWKNISQPELCKLKCNIRDAMKQLNKLCENPGNAKRLIRLDLFHKEYLYISQMGMYNLGPNLVNVDVCINNEWVNCYEILNHYNLLSKSTAECVHLDNSGNNSFILATNHYIKTMCGTTSTTKHDAKYPSYSWYSTDDMLQNNTMIDLYTSCNLIGEELTCTKQNIGKIIQAVKILKKKGHMIINQCSIFEPITLCMLYCLATAFNQIFLCTLCSNNYSEQRVYIICKDYVEMDKKYVEILSDKLTNDVSFEIGFFDAENDKFKKFVEQLNNFSMKIHSKQMEYVSKYIDICNFADNVCNHLHGRKKELIMWYNNNPIYPINRKHMIKKITRD